MNVLDWACRCGRPSDTSSRHLLVLELHLCLCLCLYLHLHLHLHMGFNLSLGFSLGFGLGLHLSRPPLGLCLRSLDLGPLLPLHLISQTRLRFVLLPLFLAVVPLPSDPALLLPLRRKPIRGELRLVLPPGYLGGLPLGTLSSQALSLGQGRSARVSRRVRRAIPSTSRRSTLAIQSVAARLTIPNRLPLTKNPHDELVSRGPLRPATSLDGCGDLLRGKPHP